MSPNRKRTFPLKLWQLVNDSRLDSAIRWADDGHSFFVFEMELRNMCLGKENKLFFTREPKSFIRQLHLYGFRKINKNQFKHPYFQRDRPSLLNEIKRTYRIPQEILEPILEKNNSLTNYSVTTDQSLMTSTSICSLCVCAGCCGL